MRTITVLLILLGVQSILAGFPYTVKLSQHKITSRKLLLVYSTLMVIALCGLYTYMVIMVVPGYLQTKDNVQWLLSLLVTTTMHFIFLITLIYNLVGRSKLRDIVDTTIQLHVTFKKSLTNRFDWKSVFVVCVTAALIIYLLIVSDDFTNLASEKIMSIFSSSVVLPLTCLAPLIYNVFLRLCALYLSAMFKHIEEALKNPLHNVLSVRDQKITEHSVSWTGSALTISSLESARRDLYRLDELVMNINRYFGFLICMNLGYELLMAISYLQILIDIQYVYITLGYFLLSCLKILLILNAPESFTKKVIHHSI